MLLWLIEPKIDWNQLMQTIESKNVVAIMIVNNSDYMFTFSDQSYFNRKGGHLKRLWSS